MIRQSTCLNCFNSAHVQNDLRKWNAYANDVLTDVCRRPNLLKETGLPSMLSRFDPFLSKQLPSRVTCEDSSQKTHKAYKLRCFDIIGLRRLRDTIRHTRTFGDEWSKYSTGKGY